VTALLSVRDLGAGYGGSTVLQGVDFELDAGQVVGLLGRNGVGKSTFVLTVMGMVAPTSGSVRLAGRELAGARPDVIARAGIALVPQGRRIFAPLTVEENLAIGVLRARPGPWSMDRVYELMPRLAERRRHRGDQLSGGEQQMLAIGRALVANPVLILLDEPSDGLAPAVVNQVSDLLRTLAAEGASVLLVEQDLHLAFGVCAELAVMDRGRIVHRASTVEFRSDEAAARRLLGVG
jgi:branched-chain amino acid transport system ATP-binding protein